MRITVLSLFARQFLCGYIFPEKRTRDCYDPPVHGEALLFLYHFNTFKSSRPIFTCKLKVCLSQLIEICSTGGLLLKQLQQNR